MDKIKRNVPRFDSALVCFFWLILLRGLFELVEGGYGIFMLLTAPENALTGSMALSSGYLMLSAENGFGISLQTAITVNLIKLTDSLLVTVVLCLGIKSLRRILDSLLEGQPFHASVSRELRFLAILSGLFTVSDTILGFVTQFTLLHGYDIDATLANGVQMDVSFHQQTNYALVVLTVALFFLSWIFRYGEELQTLSDETL